MRRVARSARLGPAAAVATVLLTTVLLAACSSSTSRLPDASAASALPDGAVTGAIRLVGGPAGTTSTPGAGEVFAYFDAELTGRPVATARASSDGRFDLRVPAGRYYLAGTSPQYSIDPKPATPPCRAAARVDVTAGRTSHADVICPMR